MASYVATFAAVATFLTACCPTAPPVAPCPCAGEPAQTEGVTAVDKGPEWLIEDFESQSGRSGGLWFEFDKNPLGTEAHPAPFVLADGGSPASAGHSAHIWGKLGANQAPWSWVQLQVILSSSQAPVDLTAYRSVSFYVKGDGGRYGIAFVKDAVKDYDEFHYEFTAPTDWTLIEVPFTELRQYGWGKAVPQVFDDVKRVQFFPAQYGKPFELSVDHVVLTKTVTPQEPVAYDTEGWFPWTGFDPKKRTGTALDVSRLLDAPAGKHGPLGAKGERFVFKDGKDARFLGVNIVASANFPTHAEAEKLAELLAQMGVNMTRHHHIDAPWSRPNIFGNAPGTLELDAAMLERFDYLVHQLQQRGIYQYFDLLVHRKVSAADGVPEGDALGPGLKIHGEFDPKLIELQERFIEHFLGHVNAYSKRSYAQDPAVVLVEVINESSLFGLRSEGDFSVRTPEAKALMSRLFIDWLEKKVPGGRRALDERWAGGGATMGLSPGEDPEKGHVDADIAIGDGAEKGYSPARVRDTLSFYYDTMLSYYKRIEARLRTLGYKGLVTGSNHWTEHPLDLLVNAQLGFLDRHSYWAHPQGGWGYGTNITWDPSPMVKDPNLGIVGSLARRRVRGLPYFCSEWQTSAPNDFRHEGLVLMAAYAGLQGFHPLQFAISHEIEKSVDRPGAIASNFDVIEQPTALGAWPAAALLFHRGDVRPSDLEAFLKLEKDASYAPAAAYNPPARLGLIARTGVDFEGGQSAAELKALRARYTQGSLVTSSTGELRHDASAGRFELDTPKSQGFVGFKPNEPVDLGNVTIALDSAFAVVVVTSLDDRPIASARRWLVTALGNAVNTGMKLTPSGNRLADPGRAPVLVEPIRGKVSLRGLKGGSAGLRAYALDAAGTRAKEVQLQPTADGAVLELGPSSQTMHYELVAPAR